MEALRQTGEYILSLFESLLDRCDCIENDSTIFIEPFMELLIEFRSLLIARDILQNICRNNFGNGILEEIYLEFLHKYFPNRHTEIEELNEVSLIQLV